MYFFGGVVKLVGDILNATAQGRQDLPGAAGAHVEFASHFAADAVGGSSEG